MEKSRIRSARGNAAEQQSIMIAAGILATVYVFLTIFAAKLSAIDLKVGSIGHMTAQESAALEKIFTPYYHAVISLLIYGMLSLVLLCAIRISLEDAGVLYGLFIVMRVAGLILPYRFVTDKGFYTWVYVLDYFFLQAEPLPLLLLSGVLRRYTKEPLCFFLSAAMNAVWAALIMFFASYIVDAVWIGMRFVTDALPEIVRHALTEAATGLAVMMLSYGIIALITYAGKKRHKEISA